MSKGARSNAPVGGRRWVSAVFVLAVTASCGGTSTDVDQASGSSTTDTPVPSATTDTTVSSGTTDTTVPATTSHVLVAETAPPTDISAPPGQWLRITREDGTTQLAAVYRPEDDTAHPIVVVLHGTGGLLVWQLQWAATLAEDGYVVVVGCYLNAAAGWEGQALACPGLPDALAESPRTKVLDAEAAYYAILDAAVGLEGVQPDTIGVVGLSVGGGVALSFDDPRVTAIVADSYFRETPGTVVSPVLLLGFTEDPIVTHDNVVAFEQAQEQAGSPVEPVYYPGDFHLALNRENTHDDATARVVAFLGQHLG